MSLACNISLNVSHASTICVDLIEHCQVGKMAENITIVGGFWGCLVLEGFGRDDSFSVAIRFFFKAARKRHILQFRAKRSLSGGFQ